MSFLSRLLGKREDGRDALRPLWHRIVAIAREPQWYARCGIADTVPGRFDAITLVLALVLLRMESEGELIPPTVRLTELFVDDMDGQLRESGVGDLVVGKRMGKLMGVLGGRLGAYREALAHGAGPETGAALAEAITRNVTLIEGGDPAKAAAEALLLARQLQATSAADLLTGAIAR